MRQRNICNSDWLAISGRESKTLPFDKRVFLVQGLPFRNINRLSVEECVKIIN